MSCRGSCQCAAFLVVLVFLCVGVVLIAWVPKYIHKTIANQTGLQNGSEFFKAWLSPPVTVNVEFYLFSVQNPTEVGLGDRPVVQQLGPYVYRQIRSKEDVELNPDQGTVSYNERKLYVFIPELSAGSEADNLTILNLAYVAVAEEAMRQPKYIRTILNIIELYYKENLFLEKSVGELIWGYSDPVLEHLSKVVPIQTVVGLFVGKNGSTDGTYVISDGIRNSESLGQVRSYRNSSSIGCWSTDWANMINGSDGSLIPPFRSDSDTIYLFAADICRSFAFVAETESNIFGVPTLAFTPPPESLLSPDLNPDNRGFCLDYPKCLKSGVLNMSSCLPGAPVVISLPHFYQADESYQQAIIGLHPRPDMLTRLDIEPLTGIVFRGRKLLQINGIIRQNSYFTALHNVRDTLLPIGYYNESMVLPEEVALSLWRSLMVPLLIVRISSACLITLGGVGLFVLFSIYLVSRRSEPIAAVITSDEESPLIADA